MKTNNLVNSISGSLTKTIEISGYSLPISKYYTGTLTPTSQNLSTDSNQLSGMSVLLPNEGIYEIKVNFLEDLSSLTSSVSANYSTFYFIDNSMQTISNSERLGFGISSLTNPISGINKKNKYFLFIFQNSIENNMVALYGKVNSVIVGNWKILSGNIIARLIA